MLSDVELQEHMIWFGGAPRSQPTGNDGALQQQDGSLHVATRALTFQPYFESGFPHGHDQWISQAGTAMAAIALSFAE